MGYADDIANLETRRSTVCAELAEISLTSGTPGSLPNVAQGDGVNVDHVGYRKSLLDELAMLDDRIEKLREVGEGPAVLESEVW